MSYRDLPLIALSQAQLCLLMHYLVNLYLPTLGQKRLLPARLQGEQTISDQSEPHYFWLERLLIHHLQPEQLQPG